MVFHPFLFCLFNIRFIQTFNSIFLKFVTCCLVEHQFEVTVEDIRGLSIFGSTVHGETDCFVQYHFPHQTNQVSKDKSFDGK